MGSVTTVLTTILVIAVLAIVAFLVITNLRDTYESTDPLLSGSAVNETLTAPREAGAYLTTNAKRNCKATVSKVTNATLGTAIAAPNYTVAGCHVYYSAAGADASVNSTTVNWNVTYTYTYNSPYADEITKNMTKGTLEFFDQTPTFFTLLAVVVLILIIAIVVVVVMNVTGGRGSGYYSEEL